MQKITCFEEVPRSCGEEKVNPLMEAILQQQVLRLSYKKYHQDEEKTYLYHPYFLKEYRNRWYVLGWYEAGECMKTFALDRISCFAHAPEEIYQEQHKPEPDSYFKNTIGITLNGEPQSIKLKYAPSMIPYLRSQPLHESQEIVEECAEFMIITLQLTINYELESLLLGFADEVEVLEPEGLKNKIAERMSQANKRYPIG